jgi:S-adenosylmethionine:tRNA ribosyltransferase-isomerase
MTDLKLSDFDYNLPKELIATSPSEKRDKSRLMCVDRTQQSLSTGSFRDILNLLGPDDVLVLNDTKVIKARLIAHRSTGARIEIFLVEPVEDGLWKALVKPQKRVKEDDILKVSDHLSVRIVRKEDGYCVVKLESDWDILDALQEYGHVPIPPYIQTGNENSKTFEEQYQTVFASTPGAVAAPTAGLHFTEDLLDELKQKGVTIETVTLHVGYGTFQPITDDTFTNHTMHSERYMISEDTAARLNAAKHSGKRIVAVGTTSVRTLETASQHGPIHGGESTSELFIYPGYTYRFVDAMITNFHLPKSSLLLLVSAFSGKDLMDKAYKTAISEKFRFFSFGDAMFIY